MIKGQDFTEFTFTTQQIIGDFRVLDRAINDLLDSPPRMLKQKLIPILESLTISRQCQSVISYLSKLSIHSQSTTCTTHFNYVFRKLLPSGSLGRFIADGYRDKFQFRVDKLPQRVQEFISLILKEDPNGMNKRVAKEGDCYRFPVLDWFFMLLADGLYGLAEVEHEYTMHEGLRTDDFKFNTHRNLYLRVMQTYLTHYGAHAEQSRIIIAIFQHFFIHRNLEMFKKISQLKYLPKQSFRKNYKPCVVTLRSHHFHVLYILIKWKQDDLQFYHEYFSYLFANFISIFKREPNKCYLVAAIRTWIFLEIQIIDNINSMEKNNSREKLNRMSFSAIKSNLQTQHSDFLTFYSTFKDNISFIRQLFKENVFHANGQMAFTTLYFIMLKQLFIAKGGVIALDYEYEAAVFHKFIQKAAYLKQDCRDIMSSMEDEFKSITNQTLLKPDTYSQITTNQQLGQSESYLSLSQVNQRTSPQLSKLRLLTFQKRVTSPWVRPISRSEWTILYHGSKKLSEGLNQLTGCKNINLRFLASPMNFFGVIILLVLVLKYLLN